MEYQARAQESIGGVALRCYCGVGHTSGKERQRNTEGRLCAETLIVASWR